MARKTAVFAAALALVLSALTACDDEPTGGGTLDGCGSGPACAPGERCMGGSCVRTVRGDTGTSRPDLGLDGAGDPSTGLDGDTAVEDTGLQPDVVTDTTVEDPGHDATDVGGSGIRVVIEVPGAGSVFDSGSVVVFVARVFDDRYTPTELTALWTSSRDGVLDTTPPDSDGRMVVRTTTLSPGTHTVTVVLEAPDLNTGEKSVDISICGWGPAESFDSDLSESMWTILGHASRDERGWLEMTGNYASRKGAIFNISNSILPGDIQIRFRISTGQCDAPGPCGTATGADGFAMSVFAAMDSEELLDILDAGHSGGGLGYGVSGDYGDIEVDAFHVEFDTWHNIYNGDTEFHTDPIEQNHVAITLDGDPGNHVLYAAYSSLEDNEWHDVEVTIDGIHVVVTIDDVEVINGDVEGLAFKGGYIGFSGTTGYYHNYHRFDDLAVIDSCEGE